MTNAVALAQGASNNVTFRNRIINGGMVVNQRATTVTNTAAWVYTVDRFAVYGSQASKFTAAQSSTAPAGFYNSLLLTSSSAYSLTSADEFLLKQPIEGYNVADLNWGSSNAKTVVLSFWVQSSLTGLFSGNLRNATNDRCYVFSYTITSTNTWQQITITVPGDTTGTWNTTNGVGIAIWWTIGTGSTYLGTAGSWGSTAYDGATGTTSLVGTSGATLYITGVQLEAGTTASPFEYRQYGTELSLCQRYYWKSKATNDGMCYGVGTSEASFFSGSIFNPVPMRTTPSHNFANLYGFDGSTAATVSSVRFPVYGPINSLFQYNTATNTTTGRAVVLNATNTSAYVEFSAEL